MKFAMFAVHDSAAEAFARPMFLPAKGAAVRTFADEVNRVADDNPLYKHPEHFDLYELGSYDDATGKIEALETPKHVVAARDLFAPVGVGLHAVK